ncbi:MAG: carboxyl transferase domain-containing protein [Acidobacteriota bacterium]
MERDFKRIAIVNRGEPAMRLIHAVREFNQEHGTKLRTIALFTEPDENAMFVREADEAFLIGPALTISENGQRKHSYLDYKILEDALISTAAEAVWVGWGFVAEHAEFADLCSRLGIVFIGPSGDVMRKLGDKISSKRLAEQAQVPVSAWYGPIETLEEAYRHAQRLGFPLMIKATAGGGGRGIRKVLSESELATSFESARSEALSAFGNATVFLEKLVTDARHIEVQIIGDQYGTIWAVGVRDCSIQRRHQKVIEESSSTAITAEQQQMLREAAVRLGQTVGYQNAGTVEFLYNVVDKSFSFMEVNARLQVEHPVTEVTTDLDLVKMQLQVARGERIIGEPPLTRGHAIEARLNAEDPDNRFAPAPGKIALFETPTGPGLRIDTGVKQGDEILSQFDSMIAKIIAFGRDREEAISRLRRALMDFKVAVIGGTTNKTFLLELLNKQDLISGEYHNNWLDQLMSTANSSERRYAEIALLQAAINVYDEELAIEQAQFYSSAQRGRPSVRKEVDHTIELSYRSQQYKVSIYRLELDQYRIDLEGRRVGVNIRHLNRFEKRLTILNRATGTTDERHFHILSIIHGITHQIEVDGISHSISRDEGGVVRSPSPAIVVALTVKEGDEVEMGQQLVVLEAMKMEMSVVAPFAGKIREILVSSNTQVVAGAPLISIDPQLQENNSIHGQRISFATIDEVQRAIAPASSDTWVRYFAKLARYKRLLLGFDIDQTEVKRLLAEKDPTIDEIAASDKELLKEISRRKEELLKIFVDLNDLFRRKPLTVNDEIDEVLVSDEYLISYLRALDERSPGIPTTFFEKLKKVLSHYELFSLEKSPRLAECMLLIYKAQKRYEQNAAAILSILERNLEEVGRFTPGIEFRELLNRVIFVTQNRAPALNDVARELQYRYFEGPLFEQARQRVYQQVERDLDYLVSHPAAYDYMDRLDALVKCSQPLVSLFSSLFDHANYATGRLMLEVLTRRYYRIRPLEKLNSIDIDGKSFATAEYAYEGKLIHVITTQSEFSNLIDMANSANRLIESFPPEDDIVIDFYLRYAGPLKDVETAQQGLHEILNSIVLSRPIRRIVVALACINCGHGMRAMQHFTFRPKILKQISTAGIEELSVAGYQEEKQYRNLHPMMGKRLHIWRLSNFKIERLPSAEDVYLFHGIALDNPKDERLFALAEVRDLTPVRNENGMIVQLPHMERMLMEALADIRMYQYKRAPHERLQWNLVLLYVWPLLDLKTEEIEYLAHRLAPATEGLGLEQVAVRAQLADQYTGKISDILIRISNPAGKGLQINYTPVPDKPLQPLTEYEQKVVRLLQRGLIYPYELIKMLTPSADSAHSDFPVGEFVEYDLDSNAQLAPVDRTYGKNSANIVVGILRNFTKKYPEGMTRVVLLGDPSKEMGSLAEAECKRIIGAIDLAERLQVPLEWFAISAGAKISMESGTENMDWIALVLRRLIGFTQAGGEVNIIVNGINVGAQPYWNAEATMLMHTRGVVIMTSEGAMVLTGKQALDYSGSVSAEDNFGIGGYERVMGPNGQAQYFARDINEACHILLQHYNHTYIKPGEHFPRRFQSTDPVDRNVCLYPHSAEGFSVVGEIFSDETNPGRKRPFEIRRVMRAVTDQDEQPLERWIGMRDADTAVVWDAHIGGYPVCLLGFESHPIPRTGFIPADGPEQWTSGTLFPQASKKIARAINAASKNRPVVILANLAGFDGSPESMRKIQLEYGAEIGRAIVNFKGPIIFCVISRYHGGAFVVFSRRLNEQMEVTALEGTYASVIGGAPAAAVVFAREVDQRTRKDPRIRELEKELEAAVDTDKRRLRTSLNELYKVVHSEKLGEVAEEFDHTHSVHRALRVGSLDRIIPPEQLRPYIIDAIERGIKRELSLEAKKQGV